MSAESRPAAGALGFLLLGFCAAALGVLIAPRSGKDTRRRINDWVGRHEGEDGLAGRLSRLMPFGHHRLSAVLHNGHEFKREEDLI